MSQITETVSRGSAAGALTRQHWVAQVDRNAQERPDTVALGSDGRLITWEELAERTRRLAGWLRDAGVERGDRVALVLSNGVEFVELMVATSRLGAMTVPLNFRLTSNEMGYILEHSGASVVASDTITLEAVRGTGLHDAAHHLHVADEPVAETVAYQTAVAHPLPDENSWPDVAETEPAFIMYTSGTTGLPKGAVRS